MRAFWKYDKFPYLLSGTVTTTNDKGWVETKEFGPGHRFDPIKILPDEAGLRVHNNLVSITQAFENEEHLLQARYKEKVESCLPW